MHPPGILEENLAPECHKGMVNPKEAAKVRYPNYSITTVTDRSPQSLETIEAEKTRVAKAREALPPVETMLGLDELQVSLSFSRKT